MSKRFLFGFITIAVLSGCKIVVVVPEGGKVVSESGAHVCNAGETCEIPVIDIFFDETFIAEPGGDYNFVHWQKAAKHFCGETVNACRLYTTLFEGFPALMAFLESDEKFYLRPIFLEKGGFDNQPANACFNPVWYEVGARFFIEDRSTIFSDYLATAPTIEIHQETEGLVEGRDEIDGRPAIKTSVDAISTWKPLTPLLPFGDQVSFIQGESYSEVNFVDRRVTQIASIVTSQAAESNDIPWGYEKTYTETLWKPGRLMRYDLMAGDSFSFTNSAVTHNETWAGAEHEVKDYESTVDVEIFYRGVETITVPAGTFQACRFESWVTSTDQGSEPISARPVISWYGVGNGVLLKTGSRGADGAAVTELLSASINGQPIIGIEN